MEIAIISDLHIGSGDQTDRFGHDDYEFLRFLKFLESNFERIVLLGDIFETLTGPKYGQKMLELKRCFQAHPEVSRRLVGNRQKYIYLHGNHDLVSAEAFCTTGEHFMGINGTSILFTHGDIFDTMNSRARHLAEWLVWLGGHLLRGGGRAIFEICKKIDEFMLGSGTEMSRSDFNSRAVLAARAMGIDTIVTGHSHAGGTLETGDTLLLNSGGCLEGRFQYISMNPVTLEHSYNPVW